MLTNRKCIRHIPIIMASSTRDLVPSNKVNLMMPTTLSNRQLTMLTSDKLSSP
jgi:hypothetical protein